MADNKIVLVGLSWFRSEEDFLALRPLLADPGALPATYEVWLARAKQQVREVEGRGLTVHRAYLDPVAFPLWCEARHLDIDAEARRRFAAEDAARRFERKDG